VIALVRYTLANVVLSQRYLPPVLLFFVVLVVFTGADSGPLPPVYAVSAGAVFACGTWLTIVTVNAEDPTRRAVTVVSAGGSGRVLAASVWVAFVWCVCLGVVGLLYPLAVGHHRAVPAAFALGSVAELTGACTGIAVGLLCSRIVLRRAGVAVLAALAAIFAFLLVPGLPPVRSVFLLLAGGRPASAVLAPAIGFAAVAVVLLVGSSVLTRFVARRKD
jgi:hypothetical protein